MKLLVRKSVVPSEGPQAKNMKPTKSESRKMQRDKKRNDEVEKLNKDLKKPTPMMMNNKKDRKVLSNQVICSQNSMAMKMRAQRTDELKTLLLLADDPIEKKELTDNLKAHLKYELKTIDLCETSSDEDVEYILPKVTVSQSSIVSKTSPTEMRRSLPGTVEKWGNEAASGEGENDPREDEDRE